jgi:TonB family protein
MMKRIFIFLIAIMVFIALSSPVFAGDGKKQKKSSPGIDELVDVDELPSPTKQVPPSYPPEAKKQGLTGTVHIKLLVGTNGIPKDARIIKSVTASLDSAALNSALQWRFKPGLYKGKPVEVWVVIPFKFALAKDTEKPKNK